MFADVSWESHIGKVGSRGRSSAICVMSVLGSHEEEMMMTLYHSFVHSQLEYCFLLWHPQKIGDIEVIEGIHRAFTSRPAALLWNLSLQKGRNIHGYWWPIHTKLADFLNRSTWGTVFKRLQWVLSGWSSKKSWRYASILNKIFNISNIQIHFKILGHFIETYQIVPLKSRI